MPFNVISPEDVERGLVHGLMLVFKRWGETPLETLGRLRKLVPGLEKVPLSYAGRLDPLAEGVMLVLCGEANKERQAYLGLDKEYEFEVLFGLRTDTGDLLGMIDSTPPLSDFTCISGQRTTVTEQNIGAVLSSLRGAQSFPYPAFSSKTVYGKPLFEWFKEGRLSEIDMPTSDVVIEKLDLLCVSRIAVGDVVARMQQAASAVSGDFRQEQILASVHEALIKNVSANNAGSFQVAKIRMSCSSGTYVRVLSERIGFALGMPALAYSIRRTRVGKYEEKDAIMGL